jgi:hypothetical protein
MQLGLKFKGIHAFVRPTVGRNRSRPTGRSFGETLKFEFPRSKPPFSMPLPEPIVVNGWPVIYVMPVLDGVDEEPLRGKPLEAHLRALTLKPKT